MESLNNLLFRAMLMVAVLHVPTGLAGYMMHSEEHHSCNKIRTKVIAYEGEQTFPFKIFKNVFPNVVRTIIFWFALKVHGSKYFSSALTLWIYICSPLIAYNYHQAKKC